MEKSFGKFLAGAAVGTAAGVALGKYLASEEGKKKKEKMMKRWADWHAYMRSKMEDMKGMEKSKYKQIITSVAEEYGKVKKLSDDVIDDLVKKTLALWDGVLEKPKEQ